MSLMLFPNAGEVATMQITKMHPTMYAGVKGNHPIVAAPVRRHTCPQLGLTQRRLLDGSAAAA